MPISRKRSLTRRPCSPPGSRFLSKWLGKARALARARKRHADMEELAELRDALDRLHTALDDLAMRGLRAAGPQDLARLTALRDEFKDAGAGHIAERLTTTIDAVRADDRNSAASLLRSMVASRLFDR